MNAKALAVILSLIQHSTAIAAALQKVSDLIRQKQNAGEDVTMDDLKALQLDDDLARDSLLEAIEEAEK